MKSEFSRKRLTLFSFLVVFAAFFVKSVIVLDPDFGWHFKAGEYISQHGFPQGDIFSYTMPSYTYAYHEWLQDVLFYKIQNLWGKIPLAVFYSFVGTLAIFISGAGPLLGLLMGSVLLDVIRVNPQVVSWLLFVLVLRIVRGEKKSWKVLVLPLIFLLWANLHGGFVAGLLLVLVYGLFKGYFSPVVALTFVLTLINPFGFRLWREIYLTLSDLSLRSNILEWTPSLFWFNPGLYFLVVLACVLLFRYPREVTGWDKLLFVFFLFQMFSSIRNVPYWLLFLPPLLNGLTTRFQSELKGIKYSAERLEKIRRLALPFVLLFFALNFCVPLRSWLFLTQERAYPHGAVEYLRRNLPQGRVFAPYGWGGYLIWKFSESKVFIDGRMPSWKNPTAPESESKNAFADYRAIVSGKVAFAREFGRYGIDTVLWYSASESRLGLLANLFDNRAILVEELKQAGWKEVYRDSLSVVYQQD